MRNQFTFKTFFLSLLVLSSAASANEVPYCEPSPCCFSLSLVEVKAGYFFFSNSKLRRVYDKGGIDLQLCATYPLWELPCNWTFNLYGALEYFQRSGRSINGNEKTSVWSVPVNLGVKPVYTINSNLQYYFAFGPRYLYLHQHNHSSFVYKNRSKNALGFFINTGINYLLCNNFAIDLFGEYSYAKIHFHGRNSRIYTRNIQVGGFTFGGGLGYEF